MSTKAAPGAQESTLSASPKIVEVESLADRMTGLYNSIAERAHALFHYRGREEGKALDDWLRAESELLHPTSVEMLESDDSVIVHADVPGFKAKDIEVNPVKVDPVDVRLAIEDALERRAEREAERIGVAIVDGVVVVSGPVHSWREKRAILGAVNHAPGVRSVDDHLRIDPYL